MTNELVLSGCTPTPLASYLKALGVLRLVAEAENRGGDAEATGFWRDDVFVLRTRLTKEELCAFVLDRYHPTPLVAPWNGGGGFYFREGKSKAKDPVSGKKLKTGVRDEETEATRTVAEIEKSTTPRFEDYRRAVVASRQVISSFKIAEAPANTSNGNQKDRFVQAFRNIAPDQCLAAMDSAVLIAGDEVSFPPMFGTGGNDGNLDFTNNFMQRLLEVIDVSDGAAMPHAATRLDSALFDTPCQALSNDAFGQFAPGSAGGPNASSGFEGCARTNAWDFILALEGAVLFAASAVRRLESGDRSILSAPFVVRSRLATEGTASAGVDDDDSRHELWVPLWASPIGVEEVRSLLSEGRATVNGRAVRDGLDFARAVVQFGVNRGIRSFQRYAFLRRQGKNFLATPLSRIVVRRSPDADLITELDRRNWLASVQQYARDETAPKAFRAAAHQLHAALLVLTQQGSRAALQAVLRQLGHIEATVSRSPKSQEAVRAPAPRLSMAWAERADDASAEFRIAAALGGLCLQGEHGQRVVHARRHLASVSEVRNREGDREWEATSRLTVWGHGPLIGNLAALLHRRRLESISLGLEGDVMASRAGATRADVAAFLEGNTDDRRIDELLGGLVCVDWSECEQSTAGHETQMASALPPMFALLKVFFTPESVLRALGWLPPGRTLRLPAEIPARLAADDVEGAGRLAWQRLRALGVELPGRVPPQVPCATGTGARWLAGLCIPLSFSETAQLLRGLDLFSDSSDAAPQHTEVTP